MKICPVCNNHEPGNDARFCSECGYRFEDSYEERVEREERSYDTSGAGKRRRRLSYGMKEDTPLSLDRPVRQKWPFIVGGVTIVIVVATAIFFAVSDHNFIMSQEKKIQKQFSHIENLRNSQKENYLDEALEDWKGDEFYSKAKEIKDNEDAGKEQQLSAIKELREKFDKYDEELVSGQTRSLNMEYSKVQGKYEESFLIEGEKEKIDAFEKEYDTDIDEHLFKSAKTVIENYGELEKNIANDDEAKSSYSAKHLLDEDEFMPTILDFSVFSDSYTNNGEAMGADHFTLIEQVGQKGKQKYIDIDKVSMSVKNGEYMYVLKFKTGQPDNYKKDRGYILHVRNMDGTRGFTVQEGTNPEKKIQKAVADYMTGFVKAFNSDCDADSKTFNKMKDYLEKGSQAWEDFKGQPSRERIKGEGITGQENFEVSMNKDYSKATVHVNFKYEIARYRSYGEICDNSKEDSFCHSDSTDQKDFLIRGDYVGYRKGGEYRGQELSDSSRFLCHEYLSENEVFTMNLTNNSAGKIIQHENDTAQITDVLGMSYQEDGSREHYSADNLNFSDDSDYEEYDQGDANDGYEEYDDEEYEDE